MELRKTVTSIFMVPTLRINRDTLLDNGYLSGYLVDVNRDVQYEGCIYLLFKPTNLDKFREFLDSEYERTKDIIDDYDCENGYVVLVYKLDKKWNDDFTLVRQGLYSKTSKDFQNMFPKVLKVMKNGLHRDEISLQYRIFNKTQDLREYWEERLGMELTDDMEVWNGFDNRNEELDLDNIYKKELQ
jgi:hypothetical protein